MPVMLDVKSEFADGLNEGKTIALRDREGVVIATIKVEEIWEPDKARETAGVFGTEDTAHPGVNYLISHVNPVYVGGKDSGYRATNPLRFQATA